MIANTKTAHVPSDPPSEIRLLLKSGILELQWPDGTAGYIGFSTLRAACACAGCTVRKRKNEPLENVSGVEVRQIKPVGSVGLQLVFSDGHDRGIFPWSYLRELTETAL